MTGLVIETHTLSGNTCSISSPQRLEPGASFVCEREELVTAGAADAGSATHPATVTATPFIPLQLAGEAHCTVTLSTFSNVTDITQAVIGFSQATGSLKIDTPAIEILRVDQSTLPARSVVVEAIDQMGAPMHGLPLLMGCADPAGNRLRALPPTERVEADASGAATFELRFEDRGTNQPAIVTPIRCTVADNGFEVAVTVSAETEREPLIFRDGFE